MQTNTNYCKAKGCRYINTHTTRDHVCGTCKDKGHGQYECKNSQMILQLLQHHNDMIDPANRCDLYKCPTALFHIKEAHHCEHCNNRGHNIHNCPNRIVSIVCPICREQNRIKGDQKKITGIDNECCICFDKKIAVYFPNCGHVCVCFDCYIHIST
jgi:hypothetical protein